MSCAACSNPRRPAAQAGGPGLSPDRSGHVRPDRRVGPPDRPVHGQLHPRPGPARAATEVEAAEQTAAEEAAGAGLVEFSMVVTLTVDSVAEMRDANVTMRNLLGATRIAMRPADRMQAAAFTCALPVGVLPWEQTMVPQEIQEAL
ncbi:SCO6880 family protein [Phytohabitans flavus]|uniref:SCO6880 family protein n=1 Tax=Phytohabitans flavus TaxID=1076124 RepID=UPI0036321BFC